MKILTLATFSFLAGMNVWGSSLNENKPQFFMIVNGRGSASHYANGIIISCNTNYNCKCVNIDMGTSPHGNTAYYLDFYNGCEGTYQRFWCDVEPLVSEYEFETVVDVEGVYEDE